MDSETWYLASYYGVPTIRSIEVVRRTPHCVYGPGSTRYSLKPTKQEMIVPTWELAHGALIALVKAEIARREDAIDSAKRWLARVEAMSRAYGKGCREIKPEEVEE